MSAFAVKTESLSTRCEVCHQSDLFDAAEEYCSRCSGVNKSLAKKKDEETEALWQFVLADIEERTKKVEQTVIKPPFDYKKASQDIYEACVYFGAACVYFGPAIVFVILANAFWYWLFHVLAEAHK